MDLRQIRCFIAVADELHFGRAAQRLSMLPSALGRHVRLLEEELSAQLLTRTTRQVALTVDGAAFLPEARALIAHADELATRFRARTRIKSAHIRIGVIDTAAAGLMPMLLNDFSRKCPGVTVGLTEDKTIRLLPRLLSGNLDLAIVRPPLQIDPRLEFQFLFHETAVVAVPTAHRLANRERVEIVDLATEPLLVPDRRSRPHSHDLTMKLFAAAGLSPIIAQVAQEKQTIINLVAAGIGAAIVPRWTSRFAVQGVRYVTLDVAVAGGRLLPLAAAWIKGASDPLRDAVLATLRGGLATYSKAA